MKQVLFLLLFAVCIHTAMSQTDESNPNPCETFVPGEYEK